MATAETPALEQAARTVKSWRQRLRPAQTGWALAKIWADTVLAVAAATLAAGIGWMAAAALLALYIASGKAKRDLVENIDQTHALRLTSPAAWERLCRDCELTRTVNGRIRYPGNTTTAGPLVVIPNGINPGRWLKREWITHRVRLLPRMAEGDKARGSLEDRLVTYYDYPSVTSERDGNAWIITVSLDQVPREVPVVGDIDEVA